MIFLPIMNSGIDKWMLMNQMGIKINMEIH